MTLGYDDRLFVLAFDHRGSFRSLLGVGDDPSPRQHARLEDAKRLVWEGFQLAADQVTVPRRQLGVLVDEELGAEVAREAKEAGIRLAMPVERSGQRVFDFEFGDEFGRHIEAFEPDFSKVLVRWNPGDDPADKKVQADRLSRLGAWLHQTGRKLLFELLVPPSDADLERVGGDGGRYDTELRPGLTLRAVREIRDLGVEPDIWKTEGLDDRADGAALADLVRDDGRDGVIAIVLGRGADAERVEHWLRTCAPVEGFRGFAIGRSIFSEAVTGYAQGGTDRVAAAERIATNFTRFLDVYLDAETS